MQYADALATMIESGEIKREDIIVQTKVVPAKTAAEFKATFEVLVLQVEYFVLLTFK